MSKNVWVAVIALALCVSMAPGYAATISGKVVDASGKAMEGVMLSAFDEEREMSVTVFSQADGSFTIDELRDTTFNVRARLQGQLDVWEDGVEGGTLSFAMKPATGEALEQQRTGTSGFSMQKFDSKADKENFKMMCGYCHQLGTIGYRSPEEPVDWETMITRMDGFAGLYKHLQDTLVQSLLDTYSDEAVANWPPFVPEPAPTGAATKVRITEWDLGYQDNAMIHDMELGSDGLVYGVDMNTNSTWTLNPETAERIMYPFPGKYRGPHSVELGNDGNMWFTLCVSGEMAKFDVKTKEYTITSSAVAPRPRGAYPHSLRINPEDPEGLVWYTDAGANAVFSLHPETLEVTQYELLEFDQVVGGGKGEARGRTPYGIDFSPLDGTIWYSKLNGNRIGRIDPTVEGGDIKEWDPPFRGPRRLHVAKDGIVWVPGWGSGVFGSFDPKTEEWEVFDIPPSSIDQLPYALNVGPKGKIWICGTGDDTINRFDPETKDYVTYRLPSRVTYTRELEFHEDGSIWTSNSNAPVRHTERGRGSIIKLEILDD